MPPRLARPIANGRDPLTAGGAVQVTHDGKPLITPRGAPLVVPTRALADAIAREWAGSDPKPSVDRLSMTHIASAVVDQVAPEPGALRRAIAAYAETDLVCYRADAPAGLAQRQRDAWDPMVAWAARTLDAPLLVTAGIVHVQQPQSSLDAIARQIAARDPFALAGLAELVMVSGSVVLGLAVAHRRLSADDAWALCRVDETWQAERWGWDDEAQASAAAVLDRMRTAERFLDLASA